ncbi:MAG TPA: hypothetical protein VFQ54_04715 [Thermomicrobiales bacterium]|nr:hypothetical protein [Thermomicrobiales bacterium]
MRTTVNLDEDVLLYVKSVADRSHKTLGETISDLVREAIATNLPEDEDDEMVIPRRPDEPPVTLEFVKSLREELG